MSDALMSLLESSPYLGVVMLLLGGIKVLWSTLKKKDIKIADLAESVIRATTEFEHSLDRSDEKTKELKLQSTKHHEEHERIIELLKDIIRTLKK